MNHVSLIKRVQTQGSRGRSLLWQPVTHTQTPKYMALPQTAREAGSGITNKGFPMDGDCPEVAMVSVCWANKHLVTPSTI